MVITVIGSSLYCIDEDDNSRGNGVTIAVIKTAAAAASNGNGLRWTYASDWKEKKDEQILGDLYLNMSL